MANKLLLIASTWGLAFALSLVFRYWGFQHPDPFLVRPLLVAALLLGPSILMGIWIFVIGFPKEGSLDNSK